MITRLFRRQPPAPAVAPDRELIEEVISLSSAALSATDKFQRAASKSGKTYWMVDTIRMLSQNAEARFCAALNRLEEVDPGRARAIRDHHRRSLSYFAV